MHDQYHVVTEPPLTSSQLPPEALQPLADALNALEAPTADALAELTPEMVELAFNSITAQRRQALLRGLGIRLAAPRRAGKSLCRDILNRAQRAARQHACTCTAQRLTERVIADIRQAACAEVDRPVGGDPLARWGNALARLAVFAWCQASEVDARVLLWAARQEWLGYGVEDQRLDAVHEAAENITAFRAPDPDSGTDSAPSAEASLAALEDAVREAQSAIRAIDAAVQDGRPPTEQDVRAVSAVIPAFDHIKDAFRAIGLNQVPSRLDDLQQAAAAYRQRHHQDHAVREALAELLTMDCLEGSGATEAFERVRGVARALLDVPDWTDDERERTGALGALLEMIRLGRRPEASAELLAHQQHFCQVFPDCASVSVFFDDLRRPTVADPVDHTPDPDTGDVDQQVRPEETKNAETDPIPTPVRNDETAEDRTGANPEEPPTPKEASGSTPVPAQHPPIEETLARLITERRFGLAFHLSRATDRSEAEWAALRLAALAAVLEPNSATGADAVRNGLQQWDADAEPGTGGVEVLLLPVLIRMALVTGEPVAGAQLKTLASRLPTALAAVATAVGDRALSGALMIASPLTVIADMSEAEAQLLEIRRQAVIMRQPQRLRFHRATEIAKRWLAEDGLLGTLLRRIVDGREEGVEVVRAEADRLSRRSEINAEIDRMDRVHRPPSGKPLQGAGRHDLVHLLEHAVGLSKEWIRTTEALRLSTSSDGDWAVQEISELRQSVLAYRDQALAELDHLSRRDPALSAAVVWAGREAFRELCAVLTGNGNTPPRETGMDPEQLVDIELLKIPSEAEADGPSLAGLQSAVDRSWQEALWLRGNKDEFDATRRILECAARGVLPADQPVPFDPQLPEQFEKWEADRRSELRTTLNELVEEVRRAQVDGAVTEDQDLQLQELLADAGSRLGDAERHDLGTVRRALERVQEALPRFRHEAADRIRARLEALPQVGHDQRAQVLRHLNTGGLPAAADLVYFLEIGEPVPEIEAGESHLADFFPAIPAGLPDGVTPELVALVRDRGTHPALPVLDYTALSVDEAALAADALDGWRQLGRMEPRDRPTIGAVSQLLPALKLIGYDAKSARPLNDLPRNREYRFFEVSGIDINGRARVPAFGSQIREEGSRLRVLMVWGRPPAQLLLSLAGNEPSGTSLLVAYFGTLSSQARAELAAGSAHLQPLLVIDDAALAYLAARGNRQISTATETLLPFSGVNPYIREKRGRIGGEMFYGRDAERKSILDPSGTQVIFGGRGLGKSALLNDVAERFREQRPDYHHPLYLNLDQYTIGTGTSLGPETVWSILDQELTHAEIVQPLRKGSRSKAPKANAYERVRTGIQSWLSGDSRRRLLILMDECDRFFEADAPHFTQTKRLKGLGAETQDRAKVVFAGLHSVQRFSKLARNGPFGHLAQTPTVVGPLSPQPAADLLVEPARALGFEFEDVDLVNRVLGYCSYQPFLLQMFGSRLIEVMHRKRARRGVDGPPFTIETADVETVESDATLRADITAAFKDTLTLDDRYGVIANVLAQHARDCGLESRLSDIELCEECKGWWLQGFEQLDTEGFRAYLSEMVGLGILAPNLDGRGWHLRGPNALRMIGTAQEVEARLFGAAKECHLEETIKLQVRPELPGGRAAPLNITQIDDLLGNRTNQTRVVIGTPATGIADVADTLRSVAGRLDNWALPPIGRPSVYKQELVRGRPGECRTVISDLSSKNPGKYKEAVSPEACRAAVDQAEHLLPTTPGVTRAVVLITDTHCLDLWRDLLTGEGTITAAPVVLRRHDRFSLRTWAQRIELFDSDDRQERLFRLTGGWPLLVDRALDLHGRTGDQDEALRELAGSLASRPAARAFLDAVGVYAHTALAAGYRSVAEELGGGPADIEEVVTAIAYADGDEHRARWVFACLDALQVFDRISEGLSLEPLLRQCWSLDS